MIPTWVLEELRNQSRSHWQTFLRIALVFCLLMAIVTGIAQTWKARGLTAENAKLRAEMNALRIQNTALRAVDGDGSCAVARNGPRIICALRGTALEPRLQSAALADGDVVCSLRDRWSGRAICTLANGAKITMRRTK